MSTQTPFSFLEKTINVLIIQNDIDSTDYLSDLLGPMRVYNIISVNSCGAALKQLRSGKRFHVCITDLGMSDVENDEFYILRQYANHCSIIVYTGSKSPRKGALSIKLGAKEVFDKHERCAITDFVAIVNRYALLNLVNHRYSETSGDTISLATKILFDKSPQSVTEWADFLRISDRQLRNLWASGSGFSAKNVLFIYTIYSTAFGYFTSRSESNSLSQAVDHTYRKLCEHYANHKDMIQFLIN